MLPSLTIKNLNSPWKIQAFINTIDYNHEERLSPINVLREKRGDCFDAAVFAAAALISQGKTAFLIDLRSVRDDDHVLSVFKESGTYGAIAQSKFLGLRYRHPVYATIRELVLSYFEHYFNYYGEYTLREFSVPYYLHTRKDDWMTNDSLMEAIEEDIDTIPHEKIHKHLPKLPPVTFEQFWADVKIIPPGQKIGKKYQKR